MLVISKQVIVVAAALVLPSHSLNSLSLLKHGSSRIVWIASRSLTSIYAGAGSLHDDSDEGDDGGGG